MANDVLGNATSSNHWLPPWLAVETGRNLLSYVFAPSTTAAVGDLSFANSAAISPARTYAPTKPHVHPSPPPVSDCAASPSSTTLLRDHDPAGSRTSTSGVEYKSSASRARLRPSTNRPHCHPPPSNRSAYALFLGPAEVPDLCAASTAGSLPRTSM